MTTGELKNFLQERGLSVSEGHENLAVTALIAFELNSPVPFAAENVIYKLGKQ